jgi:hypothetical protein
MSSTLIMLFPFHLGENSHLALCVGVGGEDQNKKHLLSLSTAHLLHSWNSASSSWQRKTFGKIKSDHVTPVLQALQWLLSLSGITIKMPCVVCDLALPIFHQAGKGTSGVFAFISLGPSLP